MSAVLWEYHIESMDTWSLARANELGSLGWELVSVNTLNNSADIFRPEVKEIQMIFKKEKK